MMTFHVSKWFMLWFHSARLWRNWTYLFLLCLAVVLGACNSPLRPISFRDLCIFEKEEFGVTDREHVLGRIKDKYHVDPQKEEGGNDTRYYWQSGRSVFEVGVSGNHLVAFMQREIEGGPRLGQIVAGLGTPETLYRNAIVFEVVQYTIMLEYPSQGVTVMRYQATRDDEVKYAVEGPSLRLSEDLQVTDINCYIPKDSLNDYLREIYRIPPESLEMQKRRRIPWPGFGAWISLK